MGQAGEVDKMGQRDRVDEMRKGDKMGRGGAECERMEQNLKIYVEDKEKENLKY